MQGIIHLDNIKKNYYLGRQVIEVLKEGAEKARESASKTIEEVRKLAGLQYFG